MSSAGRPAAAPVANRDTEADRRSASPHYRIRFAGDREPRVLAWIFSVYLVVAGPYLVWRLSIVNWSTWLGPVVFLAEFYGVVIQVLFLWMTRRIVRPVFRSPAVDRTVDVLICTYHESLDVLAPTVLGARLVRGVRHVWVLDDSNRPEVAEVAGRLGARYCPRTSNQHAKAGNLNNGLRHTDAELLLVLDADHVPQPHFLERTSGYFDDPRVGFVQTPQSYHNTASFLFRRSRGGHWSEQGIFYGCIQAAKNRWNSAFFVGTSAVIRRSALEEIGGFATGTATEDIHTSIRLHARGWVSAFVPEQLAYGLEVESLREFYRQRRRWSAGSLGLLARSPDSPLRCRGLTISQRLNYLSSTFAHLQGAQRLIYYLTPIVSTFTLTAPVTSLPAFLVVFVLFAIASLGATAVFARGTYHPVHTEAHALANSFAHIGGLSGVLEVKRKFGVSSKSARRRESTWVRPALWALGALALISAARDVQLLAQAGPQALLLTSLGVTVVNLMLLGSFLLPLRSYERSTLDAATAAAPSFTERYWEITRYAQQPRRQEGGVSGRKAAVALVPLAALVALAVTLAAGWVGRPQVPAQTQASPTLVEIPGVPVNSAHDGPRDPATGFVAP